MQIGHGPIRRRAPEVPASVRIANPVALLQHAHDALVSDSCSNSASCLSSVWYPLAVCYAAKHRNMGLFRVSPFDLLQTQNPTNCQPAQAIMDCTWLAAGTGESGGRAVVLSATWSVVQRRCVCCGGGADGF